MLNRIILIGRLTRDPELKYTPQGTAVATFSLAVARKYNKEETDFIDIVVWRAQAENVAQYLSKGRMVAVEGRLQIRSYETQDGQKRRVAEVVADDVRFLERAGSGSGGGTSSFPAPETPKEDFSAAGDWESLGREVRLDEIDVVGQGDDDLPF
jgi:single-strand DNA-binding protein